MFTIENIKKNEEIEKTNMKERWKVDEGILDLVYLFNVLGLETKYSCEGHSRRSKPYISFYCRDKYVLISVLKEIYTMENEDGDLTYKHYDIGEFSRMFLPYVSKGYFGVNTDYVWRGAYWQLEDYQERINNFCSILRTTYYKRLEKLLSPEEIKELYQL